MYYRRPGHQSHRLEIPDLTMEQRRRFAVIANFADEKKHKNPKKNKQNIVNKMKAFEKKRKKQ